MASEQILSESRLTLTELAKREGVNVCTCWRWATAGVRGVVLETLATGGKRITSAEAFSRWVAAQNPETVAASGWARVPWDVIDAARDIGPHALAVYCAIARHADADGRAWPSMARIADTAGVSIRKAREAVALLVARRYITREYRRSPEGDADSTLYLLPGGTAYGAGGYGTVCRGTSTREQEPKEQERR